MDVASFMSVGSSPTAGTKQIKPVIERKPIYIRLVAGLSLR